MRQKKREIDIKLVVFKFKEIREKLENYRLRNITFLLQPFNRREKMCKFYLYIETKFLIRLNIFDSEDFQTSLRLEVF